jgi:hypothetical protein
MMIAAVVAILLAAAPPEAIVGGWVVHAHTGARLPGARLLMICGARLRLTEWTDTDGAFVFRGLPAGHCILIAALGTHTPRVKLQLRAGERRLIDVPLDPASKAGDYWTMRRVMAFNEPHVTRVRVEVPPGSAVILGGLVLDARTGMGMAGAVLILRCFGAAREQQTDADGTFVFSDVIPGECTLQVLAGTVNQTTALVFGAGERRLIDVVVDPTREPKIDPATREQMLREGDSVPRTKAAHRE